MTTPMTAAEFAGPSWSDSVFARRVLAALEEREALLGEREEWGKLSGQTIQDAAVGALVRRIREHPASFGLTYCVSVKEPKSYFTRRLTIEGLAEGLEYLDSLLPKEPEVAPSGWRYERVTDSAYYWRIAESGLSFSSATATCIPPIDREFVAKLMEGRDNGE